MKFIVLGIGNKVVIYIVLEQCIVCILLVT